MLSVCMSGACHPSPSPLTAEHASPWRAGSPAQAPPPPEAWLSSPGGLSLGSPSAPSGCERGCHRARRGGPVPSSRLPGCPAQGQPLQEDAPPHGAQPALVPGVREFGTIRRCRSGGAPRVHSALRAPEPGGCLGQAPVVPVREAAWPGVGGVPLCCSAARRLSTCPGEPRCPQLLREGKPPFQATAPVPVTAASNDQFVGLEQHGFVIPQFRWGTGARWGLQGEPVPGPCQPQRGPQSLLVAPSSPRFSRSSSLHLVFAVPLPREVTVLRRRIRTPASLRGRYSVHHSPPSGPQRSPLQQQLRPQVSSSPSLSLDETGPPLVARGPGA